MNVIVMILLYHDSFHVHVVSIIRKHNNIVCHYNVHAVIIMLKEFAQTQFMYKLQFSNDNKDQNTIVMQHSITTRQHTQCQFFP